MLIQTLPRAVCFAGLLLLGAFTFAADEESVPTAAEATSAAGDAETQTDAATTDATPSEPDETASGNEDESTTPEDAAAAARALLLQDEEWLNAPFVVLQREMQDAASDLEQGRTKPPAEMTQPLIIDRLDMMIEMLERSSGGGGGGQNPSRPANASTLRTGPDRRGEMRAPQQEGRAWADLTAQEREKILQSRTDGFPPGYDDILADYFRKLSRGEAAPEDPAADE